MPLPNIIKICLRVSKLWNAQDFVFMEDKYTIKKEVRVVSSLSLPNIIILSLTVWELWPAQDFDFREDNYIRKKVRAVSLACGMPPLHFYQTLSKYVSEYQSFGTHKVFGFKGGNYIMKKVIVVSLACDALWSSSSFLQKHYQNMS